MAPVIEVKDVRRSFGGIQAVRGCTLAVEEGSITGLIGPNGAGKTTLFRIIAGAERLDDGEVWLHGQRVDGLQPHALVAKGLVRTWQVPREFARMSVIENLMLAAQANSGEGAVALLLHPGKVREDERAARKRAEDTLAFLGLFRLRDEAAGNLSGGQKKLLELGRALMTGAEVVLLDEPVAGVNPTLAGELMDRIADLRKERGMTFFLIEHDLETVMGRCDRVIAMHEGRVLAQGKPAEVQAHPAVIDAYLGG
jgi:branched-chain amino acid transport system ATP-binding protein